MFYLKQEIITLINCYDPPNSKDTRDSYTQLLDWIPTNNDIMFGDFNARNTLWGPGPRRSQSCDTRGSHIEKLCFDKLLAILNDGIPIMAATPYALTI